PPSRGKVTALHVGGNQSDRLRSHPWRRIDLGGDVADYRQQAVTEIEDSDVGGRLLESPDVTTNTDEPDLDDDAPLAGVGIQPVMTGLDRQRIRLGCRLPLERTARLESRWQPST
ncbi:MAG TPA: hypothetical protein VLA10_02510, partial [Ilumatobacter sp.]|nr:hypothetical protein [Ilumatobacter sp.]